MVSGTNPTVPGQTANNLLDCALSVLKRNVAETLALAFSSRLHAKTRHL